MAAQISPLLDHYLAEFARVQPQLPGADWVTEQRQAALKRFVEAGFPSNRMETWKYSDTRPLQKQPFELAPESTLSQADVEAFLLPELDCYRLVFVNGRLDPALSEVVDLGETAVSLASALNEPLTSLQKGLNSTLNGHGHALSDLNLAFAVDGAHIRLADNQVLDKPIHLLFVATPGEKAEDEAHMVQVRNLIELGKNSEATVIEHYVGLGEDAYFNDFVTEIRLADNARLKRCRLQEETGKAMQVGATHAVLGRDSHFHSHAVDLGGRWVRNDTVVGLQAEGAEVHLDGLYVPTGRQHVDNQTRIDHASPHCISREDYKGILDGGSRGVFNGKIIVHKDAQKTDSEQHSAALLLSGKAEVDAKPELEIYADDVKCAHGATVGQLDEQAIFYLQSRGLDAAAARNLLTYSFADELIQRVGIEPLRKRIERGLLARLPNAEQLQELL